MHELTELELLRVERNTCLDTARFHAEKCRTAEALVAAREAEIIELREARDLLSKRQQEWQQLVEQKMEEIVRLRDALTTVRVNSLLQIRRAAFSPEIGVRYTEQIRADIANECARLEQFIEETLDA